MTAHATPSRAQVATGVSVEHVDRVAVLTIRNGPANTLTSQVRTALIEALDAAEADPAVIGVVLSGSGGRFSAGADLAEFDSGRGLAEPSLHATILSFLDAMSTPVVAAVSGLALGGGLELAMGCHYRVVSRGTLLGLPESTFGFLPGAGGTQRLPRAIGLERAVNLMLSGRPVPVEELADTALVDQLTEGDPLPAAIGLAHDVAGLPVPRLRDRALEHRDLEGFLAFVERTTASADTSPPGAAAIVGAIRAGVRNFDDGVEVEESSFRQLAERPAARAARYRFFAERVAGRLPGGDRTAPNDVQRVGVVGAGTMGRGIALAFSAAGLSVQLVDVDASATERAADAIIAERVRRPDRYAGAIMTGTEWDRLRDADLIVEAVFEELTIKQQVFRRLDELARPGAVLATNTSSLDIDAIAAVVRRPEAVVGLHFFSPANVMRLVEVVNAARTGPASLATAVAVARTLGKLPVIARVGDGFIGNRIVDQYIRQAMQLVHEGAHPHRIDSVLEAWGFRMGPFRMLDLVGNDVPALARAARGDHSADWATADTLVEHGRLGRKTGAGWYDYDAAPERTPVALDIILRERVATASRPPTDEEIVDRCVLALVNEGVRVLEDGVAARASDIDVVFTTGYGFPPGRGGPLFDADLRGLQNVVRRMRRFRDSVPSTPEFWEPSPLLVRLAENDGSLSGWEDRNA